MNRIGLILILAVAILTSTGCQSNLGNNTDSQTDLSPQDQIQSLKAQLNEKQKLIDHQTQELAILRGFPAEKEKVLVHPIKADLGRFTKPYDENKDGKIDLINVYLVLRDKQGDSIKAAGKAKIELWQLEDNSGGNLLSTTNIPYEEMPKHWLSGLMGGHYKFKIPLPDNLPKNTTSLTVKIEFEDALFGKPFELQKLIELNNDKPAQK